MSIFNRMRRLTSSTDDATQDVIEEFGDRSYLPIDEVRVALRPSELREAYHEKEGRQRADEQTAHFTAAGEEAARPYREAAAEQKGRRDGALEQIKLQQKQVERAAENRKETEDHLLGYTRRGKYAFLTYNLARAGLLGGDVAGVGGAAITLGEDPVLALTQAVAVGVSAVLIGSVGAEVRDAVLARRRADNGPDGPALLNRFRWLFTSQRAHERIVKGVLLMSAAATMFVAGGIFALRTGAEDGLSGIVFGCFAAVICAGSFFNSYFYADEVADQIEQTRAQYKKEVKALERLYKDPSIAIYDKNTKTAESIVSEFASRARAAYHRIIALVHEISFRNPAVMGHGAGWDRQPALFDENLEDIGRGSDGDTTR